LTLHPFDIERTWWLFQKRVVRTKFDISTLLLLSLARYIRWWTITLGGYHPPSKVSVETLTWFIRYVCYWSLQSLHNATIIKTKVLLPQHRWPWPILAILFFGPLVYLLPKLFKWFGFPTFWPWVYLMKFIPETHRAY